ncbi:MAG TPA: Calx-beta domain-containing protein, partial [Pirellulaceae bacterium]|nr:Calx-beta domain-containing protein [Pirellulaceae bacterium]
SLVYTFTRRGVLTNVVTANFSISGTATLNTDYTFGGAALNGLKGAVTFAPGAETVQVTATPIADAVNESSETVIVTVGTGFGYLPAAVKVATGTIANDDPQVSVWPAPSPVYEDSGSKMIFTFTRTGPLNQYLTVNFAVNGTAVYGVDYTQTGAATFGTTSGTVRFVLGASVVQVVITPKADKTVEPDETVSLIVQGGTGYFVGSLIVATTTIRDDDGGASGEGESEPVSIASAPAIPLAGIARPASDSPAPEALSPLTSKGAGPGSLAADSSPTANRLRAFSARNLAAVDSVFGALAKTAGAARQPSNMRLEAGAADMAFARLNRID